MSSIIPKDIKDIEEARKWLHKRGWSIVLAEEELANWQAPEEEIIIEDIEEEELDWDDEEEDDDWDDDEDDDDEEDEDDDWESEDDDEDEDDK